MPLSSNFSQKKHCSHAHILSKNISSLKTRFSYAYIMSKNAHSLKDTMLSSHFFFKLKTPAAMPISGQKRQFCQNYPILWAKKVNRIPFFPIFYEKINALMPIFYQKTSIL